jgi:uncharacterized cupredoxin-like copper-binding protein
MLHDVSCPGASTEGIGMHGAMMGMDPDDGAMMRPGMHGAMHAMMHGPMMGMGQGDCGSMMGQGMHGAMMAMGQGMHGAMMGMDPGEMGMPASPAPDGSAESGAVAPADSARIDVTLTDALRIEPASMQVAVGEPVTFVVTNAGVLPHEFVVGDEAVQQEHETTMQGMGSMTHDEPNAIGLEPGETKELTMTFSEPGETLAGCHIPGHYPAGMWATITVTP